MLDLLMKSLITFFSLANDSGHWNRPLWTFLLHCCTELLTAQYSRQHFPQTIWRITDPFSTSRWRLINRNRLSHRTNFRQLALLHSASYCVLITKCYVFWAYILIWNLTIWDSQISSSSTPFPLIKPLSFRWRLKYRSLFWSDDILGCCVYSFF